MHFCHDFLVTTSLDAVYEASMESQLYYGYNFQLLYALGLLCVDEGRTDAVLQRANMARSEYLLNSFATDLF